MIPFDATGVFQSDAYGARRLAVRGAGATVISSGIGTAIQIISTMVLARLLTPADFGVVTMVTTFSLLLVNFGLNGFTEAVLQWEQLSHALASNLFWINLAGGLALTGAFAGAGSLLARFYRDPRVSHVAVGISLVIFFTSTSVVHQALLKRAMMFTAVSAIDILSRIVSVAVAVSLGWTGWGYWALVSGAVVLPLVTTAGVWSTCQWVPSLPRRAPGTFSAVRFAMHVYSRFAINYGARNVDNLLVGWWSGATSLGFYKKAFDLFSLSANQLTAPLTNVAVSALSRFSTRMVEYKRHVLNSLSVTAFVGLALSADLTLVGRDLIRLLLGPRWDPAGLIFVFFAPGVGVMVIYCIHGWIHLSIGRADRWLRWGFIEISVTVLLFVFALPWGAAGIAAASSASFWILTLPALWYAGQPIGLGIKPIVGAMWKYALAALLAGSATGMTGLRFAPRVGSAGPAATFTHMVIISSLFLVLYLGAVGLLYQGYEPFYQVARLMKEMVSPPESLSEPFQSGSVTSSQAAASAPDLQGAPGKPLVSILIPAYNAQELIADTLRSALAQTWEPKEIIVVDDGSTDQTLAIAKQFESAGVSVVRQENQGAAAARNKAYSLSHGEYIQWLDADDLLAPDKIAKQMEALDKYPSKRTLLSSAWGTFMYRYYRAEFVPSALWCDLSPVEWLLHKMGQNLYMQTATWLVSRELANAAGPWDQRLLGDDDGEYFCRVILASDGVRFVPEARVFYRGPGLAFQSLSYIGQSTRKLDAHWLSMQLHIGYLRSLEDSERVRIACLRYMQTSLVYFYPERSEILEQMEVMAKGLGGQLQSPRLSWKYSWIKTIFGWRLAKNGQQLLLPLRWSLQRLWDKTLFRLDRRRSAAASSPHEPANRIRVPGPLE